MSTKGLQAPRGTFDVLPEQSALRLVVETTARGILEAAGYRRIETPIFEDTDRSRSTDENTQSILDALEWLGLDWDGEPLRQTTRSAAYDAALIRRGSLTVWFTEDAVAAWRAPATGESVPTVPKHRREPERIARQLRCRGVREQEPVVWPRSS